MQSDAPDVDTYLQQIPEQRRAALVALRELCREILAGYEERMQYGMPVYLRNGVGEVGFASQKHYISLYIAKAGVLDDHPAALAGLSVGKGCIRYRRPEQLDFGIIRLLLEATRDSSEQPC
ncbi:MAG TPA: DUF1801 domain-containing protein [Roseiflexaceae bacterium]|nr:DUF1801 domain-containing protein [Roseiflexaceae bacterium]